MKNYWKKMDFTQRYTKVSLRNIVIGLLLFLAAVILQIFARNRSGFADWYTATIYATAEKWIGSVWGLFPFSVVELLLYGVLLWLSVAAGIGIFRIAKKKRRPSDVLLAGGGNVLLLVGSLFFLYTTLCGINYHSTPFSEKNGMEIKGYTVDELTSYCNMITEEVNHLSDQVNRELLKNQEQLGDKAVQAMEQLGKTYVGLSGYYPRPKPVLLSEILSYQQLTGVYSPFTVEANYNADMTAYNIPFTMCHELSHLRGFMREDEANYIAYLACSQSDALEFQYSGALMAWIYSTNLLWEYAPDVYQELQESLRLEVRKDLKENTAFWDRYDGAVAKVAGKVNDTYLKANKQTDGVESYDRMVDLLMADYLS